jgi:hypothetical protein
MQRRRHNGLPRQSRVCRSAYELNQEASTRKPCKVAKTDVHCCLVSGQTKKAFLLQKANHVNFMDYDLGYFDLEQRTLQTIDNPFGTRLSPMSEVRSATHVSGSDIGDVGRSGRI